MQDLNDIAAQLKREGEEVIERLRAAKARDILEKLGRLPEERFIDIAALAAQVCDVPIAAVSIIDDDTAWYKALQYPDPIDCAPRDNVICNLLTKSPDDPIVIYDASEDMRVCGLPFVNGGYDYIRFYAGYPITTKEGYAVGTICVADRIPRKLRPDQMAALDRLRRLVMAFYEA